MTAIPISRRLGLTGRYGGISAFGIVLSAVTAVLALTGVITVAVIGSSRAIGRTTCHHWATQTGFKSKFVVLNFFSAGTCLAQAPNGQWVVSSQIVQFIGAKP